VDDRVVRYNGQVRELAGLQTSLFELSWSGTAEHLRKHSAYSDDPERAEFERVVEKLDRALQGAIVHLEQQQFTIAFCGTVEADKSLSLNALMGRSILPSDGESGTLSCRACTQYYCRAALYSLAVPSSPCRRPDSP